MFSARTRAPLLAGSIGYYRGLIGIWGEHLRSHNCITAREGPLATTSVAKQASVQPGDPTCPQQCNTTTQLQGG